MSGQHSLMNIHEGMGEAVAHTIPNAASSFTVYIRTLLVLFV